MCVLGVEHKRLFRSCTGGATGAQVVQQVKSGEMSGRVEAAGGGGGVGWGIAVVWKRKLLLGVLLGPVSGGLHGTRFVVLPKLCGFVVERVVRVWGGQQGLD